MSYSDPRWFLWSNAQRALDRMERLQRHFFDLGRPTPQPTWEPPMDVYEGDGWISIQVALPGVDASQIEISVRGTTLRLTAERMLPEEAHIAAINRLEIPYGRFERQISLPAGRYEIARKDLENGCLVLGLKRTGNRVGI